MNKNFSTVSLFVGQSFSSVIAIFALQTQLSQLDQKLSVTVIFLAKLIFKPPPFIGFYLHSVLFSFCVCILVSIWGGHVNISKLLWICQNKTRSWFLEQRNEYLPIFTEILERYARQLYEVLEANLMHSTPVTAGSQIMPSYSWKEIDFTYSCSRLVETMPIT